MGRFVEKRGIFDGPVVFQYRRVGLEPYDKVYRCDRRCRSESTKQGQNVSASGTLLQHLDLVVEHANFAIILAYDTLDCHSLPNLPSYTVPKVPCPTGSPF